MALAVVGRCGENGDNVADELIGDSTQGTCSVKGVCYDYRNAICKGGKCMCMTWQQVADNDVCVNPKHCSRYTGWGCDSGDEESCPDWLGGATCSSDGMCVCPSDMCATATIGYWSHKDTVPRCRKVSADEPETKQTCNKLTGGSCWAAQAAGVGQYLAETALEHLTESEDVGKGIQGMAKSVSTVKSLLEKLKEGKEMVDKVFEVEELVSQDEALKEFVKNITTKADLAGFRGMSSGFPNPDDFGEGSNCEGWRDAICTMPVTPSKAPGLLGNVEDAVQTVSDEAGHAMKSHDCMCRPQDCTVYSQKHKGLTCVFGFLLVWAADEGLHEVTFEDLSRKLYANLQQALNRRGEDDPAEFFELEHRHMLRKYHDHHECITDMHSGMVPNQECRAFVCSFASASSGFSLRAVRLCAAPLQVVGVAGLLIGSLGVLMVTLRRRQSQKALADVSAASSNPAYASVASASPLIV